MQQIHPVNLINLAGLILDIIGVLILFVHALPIDSEISKAAILDHSFDLDKHNADQKRHRTYAITGLIIVILGFALQILATFYSYSV